MNALDWSAKLPCKQLSFLLPVVLEQDYIALLFAFVAANALVTGFDAGACEALSPKGASARQAAAGVQTYVRRPVT